MSKDTTTRLELAAADGDPAARFVESLGATYEAVMRGSCSSCGAPWMPEDLGGAWGVIVEHDDACTA